LPDGDLKNTVAPAGAAMASATAAVSITTRVLT
jgi:hypothetical protein